VSDTRTYFKRCVQVFGLGLVLAAIAIVPVALERGWALWPTVAILILDIAVVFATVDYLAGQWLDADEELRVKSGYRFKPGRAHGT